ncbi:MAG: hypothetical protein ACI4F8_05175 [Lachnospiraceae bacterium]
MAYFRCGGSTPKMKTILNHSVTNTSCDSENNMHIQSFTAQAGKTYFICIETSASTGAYEYAYYTSTYPSIIQDVGELETLDISTVGGQAQYGSGDWHNSNGRFEKYLLKANKGGEVTIKGGIKVGTTYHCKYGQTFTVYEM